MVIDLISYQMVILLLYGQVNGVLILIVKRYHYFNEEHYWIIEKSNMIEVVMDLQVVIVVHVLVVELEQINEAVS